jgi:rSAM/selenodomain-associated transferase 1
MRALQAEWTDNSTASMTKPRGRREWRGSTSPVDKTLPFSKWCGWGQSAGVGKHTAKNVVGRLPPVHAFVTLSLNNVRSDRIHAVDYSETACIGTLAPMNRSTTNTLQRAATTFTLMQTPNPSRTIGLFARQPVMGQVKTRLAARLGAEVAAELYAAFLADTCDTVAKVDARRVLAITPNDAESSTYFRDLSQDCFEVWPQPEGDLGTRLTAFFQAHAVEPNSRCLVIGSDSPSLPASVMAQAFATLEAHAAVIGPATDGGFYLLGVRGQMNLDQFLAHIEWGGAGVLTQLLANLEGVGITPALLAPWSDVDTAEDLSCLREYLTKLGHTGAPSPCPRTQSLLQELDLTHASTTIPA